MNHSAKDDLICVEEDRRRLSGLSSSLPGHISTRYANVDGAMSSVLAGNISSLDVGNSITMASESRCHASDEA